MAAAEAKKAENVTILELDKASGAFTDYFVICNGSNPRQVQAISDEVEEQLSKAGQKPAHVEGYSQAEWVLLDYVDFVVHIERVPGRRIVREALALSGYDRDAKRFQIEPVLTV